MANDTTPAASNDVKDKEGVTNTEGMQAQAATPPNVVVDDKKAEEDNKARDADVDPGSAKAPAKRDSDDYHQEYAETLKQLRGESQEDESEPEGAAVVYTPPEDQK